MPTVHDEVLELRRLGPAAYRERVTVPVLVELALKVDSASDFLARPLTKPLARATIEDEDAVSIRPRVATDAPVHFLRKRPTGVFRDRIGIGRAGTDIVLAYPLISKYHAFVRREGDVWLLSDAGSRNGTFVGDDRLEPGEARPLRDRCDVRIGAYGLRFFLPDGFVDFLAVR